LNRKTTDFADFTDGSAERRRMRKRKRKRRRKKR
jgi:hypothetical protein